MNISVKQFEERLRGLEPNLQAATAMVLEPSKDYFVAIQRDRILKGDTHNGDKIRYNKPRKDTPANQAYTRRYVKFKDKRGGQTNHVDLKLDGTFLKSMEALPEGTAFVVTFTDSNKGKVSGVLARYDDIIGITQPEMIKFNELITPTAIDSVQKILLG